MATLDRWNGEDGNNCVCEYCTPGADRMGYYIGERCPKCERAEVVGHDRYVGWVKCDRCNFEAREATPEEREILTDEDLSER